MVVLHFDSPTFSENRQEFGVLKEHVFCNQVFQWSLELLVGRVLTVTFQEILNYRRGSVPEVVEVCCSTPLVAKNEGFYLPVFLRVPRNRSWRWEYKPAAAQSRFRTVSAEFGPRRTRVEDLEPVAMDRLYRNFFLSQAVFENTEKGEQGY